MPKNPVTKYNQNGEYSIDYWCPTEVLFEYLDGISPAGRGFKCSVCGAMHWGTSSTTNQTNENVLAPSSIPLWRPADTAEFMASSKVGANFFYPLICMHCGNTVLINAQWLHKNLEHGLVRHPNVN